MQYTPEIITELSDGEIFVFGSNESGMHGAGAARLAQDKFGARRGQGFGLAGRTFAIPTKDWEIQTLPLDIIQFYVERFMLFADLYPQYTFLVTKIGCGLAGLTIDEIAPMFEGVEKLDNVIIPVEFAKTLDLV